MVVVTVPDSVRIKLFGVPTTEPHPDAFPPDSDLRRRLEAMRDTDWRLLAILALSPTQAATFRVLLDRLWPQKHYLSLLDEEVDDFDDDQQATRGGVIAGGLNDLYNSGSRVRNLLRAAGGLSEGDRDPLKATRGDSPASGGYKLVLPAGVTIDAVDFVSLTKKGTDAHRLEAIALIDGPVLDLDDHEAPQTLRQDLHRRVTSVVRMLLPRDDEALLEHIADEIVRYGDMLRLDSVRLGITSSRRAPHRDPADHLLPYQIESSLISDVARSTLADLARNWAGGAAVTTPADNVVVASLPSLWGDARPIRLTFLVLAPDTAPTIEGDSFGGCCRRYRLSAREKDELTEYVNAESAPHAYCVLAVPQVERTTETQILDRGITERFNFYAIDSVQARSLQRGSEDDVLEFPVQNTLNLSVFSLLWAGRWAEDFFAPLLIEPVINNQLLAENIELVFNPCPPLDEIKRRGWRLLVDDLPGVRGEFDRALYEKLVFRLMMGSAMQLINKQMIDAGGALTDVRTYCPEALYGTANLWLFTRFYHQFMRTTANFQHARAGFVNQRLLPIMADPTSFPRIFAATLWHVVLVYRMLDAEVRMVAKPAEAAEEDHGFYGGGIGKYQWISLSPDGGAFLRSQDSKPTQNLHRVFINDAAKETIIGPSDDATTFAQFAGITPASQLDLGLVKPKLLFPRENRFIEHPKSLWSPSVVGARNHGTRF